MDIQIDTITPVADGSGAVSFQGNGSLAQRMIACGFKTNALRGATTMPNPELMKNPAIADAASKLKLNYSFVQNMAMTLGIPAEVAVPQNQCTPTRSCAGMSGSLMTPLCWSRPFAPCVP